MDDIAKETDVGVFYSFPGPVEIIIYFFHGAPLLFDFFNPFTLKSTHNQNDCSKICFGKS